MTRRPPISTRTATLFPYTPLFRSRSWIRATSSPGRVMDETQVAAIAHTIQVSVAPVFLLGGVSAMLGVLTNRLSRIVDRARKLETEAGSAAPGRLPGLREGLRRLALRARLTSAAIAFCIGCALLISSVIVVLFTGTFSRWRSEHTSELQSLMRISYAVFCLKKKNYKKRDTH